MSSHSINEHHPIENTTRMILTIVVLFAATMMLLGFPPLGVLEVWVVLELMDRLAGFLSNVRQL